MMAHCKAIGVVVGMLLLAGCQGPMQRSFDDRLRERMASDHRQLLTAVSPREVHEVSREESEVEGSLSESRRRELDDMSGPKAYEGAALPLGEDLMGDPETPIVQMTLEQAVRMTVEHNLSVEQARLRPAIDEAQIVQAEAVFDAALFANVDFQKLDTPRPAQAGIAIATLGSRQSTSASFAYGIRKATQTGGQITIQSTINRQEDNPSLFVDPSFYSTSISATISQPLLRNFGSDVNRAQIELSRNARASSIEDLKLTLLETTLRTESAYWQLVLTRRVLQAQFRLLERTRVDRDRIKARQQFDATPAQLTEANSFVQQRRAQVIRARQDVRRASDALKRLINAPDLPLSGETLIEPLDEPSADTAIRVSLLDAILTATQQRPELRQALLQIDDAAVRQRVADNQRLPVLDATASVRYNGIGNDAGAAYNRTVEANFIDWIIGGQFEAPIGNRQREAAFRQRMLERQAAVIAYQNAMRDVVLQVKNALRDVRDQYELIGAERDSRLAAADNLRTLEAQERTGATLTPEFLDLKLRRQEAMTNAEIREFQAMAQYHNAIAQLYFATGALLQRNRIDFQEVDRPGYVYRR